MKKNFASVAYLRNYGRLNMADHAALHQCKTERFDNFDSKFLQCTAAYLARSLL